MQAGPVQNFAILIVDGVIKDTLDTAAVRPDYWIDRFSIEILSNFVLCLY